MFCAMLCCVLLHCLVLWAAWWALPCCTALRYIMICGALGAAYARKQNNFCCLHRRELTVMVAAACSAYPAGHWRLWLGVRGDMAGAAGGCIDYSFWSSAVYCVFRCMLALRNLNRLLPCPSLSSAFSALRSCPEPLPSPLSLCLQVAVKKLPQQYTEQLYDALVREIQLTSKFSSDRYCPGTVILVLHRALPRGKEGLVHVVEHLLHASGAAGAWGSWQRAGSGPASAVCFFAAIALQQNDTAVQS